MCRHVKRGFLWLQEPKASKDRKVKQDQEEESDRREIQEIQEIEDSKVRNHHLISLVQSYGS